MQNSTLIIRADAYTGIGTGHVMRCLAIAQAWQRRGGCVCFVARCEQPAIAERIQAEGFAYVPVVASVGGEEDLRHVCAVAAERGAAHVVVDGYHFSAGYCRGLRAAGLTCLLLDDYCHHDEYVADIILNQNFGSDAFAYNTDAALLLGPEYALIRKEFFAASRLQERGDVLRILVTMGGEDPDNIALKALEAAELLQCACELRVIAGAANPHVAALEQAAMQSRLDVTLLHSVGDMSRQFAWADLCITAGGSTCWELCFMGVPSVVIAIADNQLGIASGLEAFGAALYAGWKDTVSSASLAALLQDLVDSAERLQELSARARLLVDGKGADRVVACLLGESAANISGGR